jgi:5-methylcytosine-specific restriction enzyme subunit McrC
VTAPRRTVRLVERRAREVRLPRADAAFLLADRRDVIDVAPAFDRGTYRLTPHGYVGWLDGPGCRFEIRPKLPWPNLLLLLGLPPEPPPLGAPVDPGGSLLAALARELADRLRAVTRAGLVRGYHEADTLSPFLRGRLRTADQLRDAAARAFPDQFHITETVFDLDAPWNRTPKAVASGLLARPELSAAVRAELASALEPLDSVPAGTASDADFDAAAREPRAAHYAPLLDLCRLVHDGLGAVGPDGAGGGFLIDLGRAFERYLADILTAAFSTHRGWSVQAQPRFELRAPHGDPVTLQPDLVIRRGDSARCALDAKWKRPGPTADDLHQVLAYSVLTGAKHVGLVYPGRRPARRELRVPGGAVRVSLVRLRVVGTAEECRRSAVALARLVRRAQFAG